MRLYLNPLPWTRLTLVAATACACLISNAVARADDDAGPAPDEESKDAPAAPAAAPEAPAKPARTDAFTLVGTLSSDKSSYAFFDGTDQEYKQVYHVGEKVGGYTLASIGFDRVTLKNAQGEVTLPLQMQLKREGEGEWKLLPLTQSFTPRVVPPPTPSAPPSTQSSDSGRSSSYTSSRPTTPAPASTGANPALSGFPPDVADKISKKFGNLSESDLQRLKDLKSMRDESSNKSSKKYEKYMRRPE